MADPTGPVVSFLLENMGRLLIEEAQFLVGVRDQAQQLQPKLSLLLSLLKHAELRQDQDALSREWISQSKDVTYDAENALETFAFKIESRRGEGIANCLKRYSCILNECYMRHRIGSDIQNLNSRISYLTTSFQNLGITAVNEREGPSSKQPPLFRRTYSHVKEDDFVGLDHDVEMLVKHLTNAQEVSSKSVVSISGMGGLGKTTIARKVYNHENVRHHFDAFAWVCISQQWQTKDILQGISVKVIPDKREEISKWTEDELVRHLYEIQQSKRCLIVLDDIWSTVAWDHLKNAFPTSERSESKILLTTRNIDVATYIGGPSGFHHQPRLLSDDESWDLLQKKAARGGYTVVHGFEELGREIAKCCGGLPLAVVVIGGILAAKHSLHEWEEVHKNIKSLLEKGDKIGQEGEFKKILSLSYNDLPYQLKPCFLYLSIYPEDCDIETETLYHLWLAEGMVLKGDKMGDESMMDVAERYLGELVKRSMIQVSLKEGPALRKFKSCRLHDLMRDLCLAKARDENFVKIVDYREGNNPESANSNPSTSSKCHRIAIFLNDENRSKYVPPDREVMKHVRSLTFRRFGSSNSVGDMATTKFEMLRALTVEGFSPAEAEKKLYDNLIHMRYLCLRSNIFRVFHPPSLGSLEHLETLDLRGCRILLKTRKMKSLRHLYLYETSFHPFHHHQVRLFGLANLEILENFSSRNCDIKDLCQLINVQVLSTLPIEEENECEEIINFISNSQSLKQASMAVSMDDNFLHSVKWLPLLQKLFRSNLSYLCLVGYLQVLPHYETNFFRNLVELELSTSGIALNLMKTLEKLPKLQSLWLRKDAFAGTDLICSTTGFPQLRFLLLHRLGNLRKWRVENGAMPNLSCLRIENCENLKMIPDGLLFMKELKALEIIGMPNDFCYRIKKKDGREGKDFYKVRHVPSIVVAKSYDEIPWWQKLLGIQ